jgi:7 transmembrane receptor (rhodopsin family)
MALTEQPPNISDAETWAASTSAPTTLALLVTDAGLRAFQALVVSIGLTGALANGLVLFVLVISTQPRKQTINMLFINQMSLDLFSCVWLVIVYTLKMFDLHLPGRYGYLFCIFLVGDAIIWIGLIGSMVNLVNIAVERYTMIVHPIWHKSHYRPWMIYIAMGFAWIVGILQTLTVALMTSVTINGRCFPLSIWPSYGAKIVNTVWGFVIYYVVILVILLYCYGRILVVARRRSRVFAIQHANNPLAITGKERNLSIQMNTVKTMILVSVSFAACWLPCQLYILLQSVEIYAKLNSSSYYVTMFVALFNVCSNPFLYAINYGVIRQSWRQVGICRKRAPPVVPLLVAAL